MSLEMSLVCSLMSFSQTRPTDWVCVNSAHVWGQQSGSSSYIEHLVAHGAEGSLLNRN